MALNKVWNTNFVDDNEILAVEKITVLANISNSLEMQLGIKFSSEKIFKYIDS